MKCLLNRIAQTSPEAFCARALRPFTKSGLLNSQWELIRFIILGKYRHLGDAVLNVVAPLALCLSCALQLVILYILLLSWRLL